MDRKTYKLTRNGFFFDYESKECHLSKDTQEQMKAAREALSEGKEIYGDGESWVTVDKGDYKRVVVDSFIKYIPTK